MPFDGVFAIVVFVVRPLYAVTVLEFENVYLRIQIFMSIVIISNFIWIFERKKIQMACNYKIYFIKCPIWFLFIIFNY